MEANTLQPQLRIGNYLQDREGNLCKVTQLGEGTIYAPALKGADTKLPNKPISVSEDWLLKLGFEKYPYKSRVFYINDFEVEFHGDRLVFRVNGGESAPGLNHYFAHHTKYIHQLQNLYFAITNEELTIKE